MGKVRTRVSKILVKFTNGQVLLGKVQFPISLLIFLKVFDFPKVYYYLFIPLVIVITIFMGDLYDRLGIRKIFDEENSKYVINKIKETKL